MKLDYDISGYHLLWDDRDTVIYSWYDVSFQNLLINLVKGYWCVYAQKQNDFNFMEKDWKHHEAGLHTYTLSKLNLRAT